MTAPTPSEIFRLLEALSTEENTSRAAAALHNIMLERGHGAGIELQTAFPLARSSLSSYRNHGTPMAPATVHRLAVIYAHYIPATDTEVDDIIRCGDLGDADQLFWLFYSPDPRAARNWLVEHRSDLFPRSAHPAAA